VATLTPLWACEICELIGSADAARRHEDRDDHPTRPLTVEEQDGVRAIWALANRCVQCGSPDHAFTGCPC
jgi:hypothetical protein